EDDLFAHGLDSLMTMELRARIQAATGVSLYPREIMGHRTVDRIATVILEAREASLTHAHPAHSPATLPPPGERGEAAPARSPAVRRSTPVAGPVFILCSPRSGSTLLRVMLAGHPDLFAPPELHLLHHRSMRAWADEV